MKKGSDLYAKVLLSTDTKPDGAFAGQLIIEKDTGDVYEWTGQLWQLISSGGAQTSEGLLLTPSVGDKATSGDTTVASIDAGDKVRLRAIAISPDATLTGDILVKIGSTQVSVKMRNAIVGGVHWMFPLTGNYLEGALGEDVVINNSVAEDISYAIYYTTV